MTLRRRHLLIIVTLIFVVSFTALNLKYDPLNRVHGIDNESRLLINRHLSKEEKQFIIDQGVHVDSFIRFIEIPGFTIFNFKVYNMIEDRGYFVNLFDIVGYGNQSVDHLMQQGFKQEEIAHNLDTIMINDMFIDFLNNPTFRVDEIFMYARVREFFGFTQAEYISVSQLLKASFVRQGISKKSDIDATITLLFERYQKETLLFILDQMKNNPQLNIVINPTDVTTFINQNYVIGTYRLEPDKLSHLGNIASTFQSVHVQTEVAAQFTSLCKEMNLADSKLNCSELSSIKGLQTFEELGALGGKDDRQVGLTLELQGSDETMNWIKQNGHKFGFIIRIDGKFRYAGVKLATEIQQKNMNWEQYHGK